MGSESHEQVVIQDSFRDYERFGALVRGFDLETMPFGREGFRAEFLQWMDMPTGSLVWRLSIRHPLRQWGATPEGRTFVVPVSNDFEMFWRYQVVSGNDIVAFPPGGELMADVRRDFDTYGITIPEERFFALADRLKLSGMREQLRNQEVFRCDPFRLRVLRGALRRALGLATAAPEGLRPVVTGEAAEALLLALSSGSEPPPGKVQPRRDRAVKLASEFAMERAQDAPTVADLCDITQVSERTLELGFLEHIGVNPKAFITANRMHGVRKQLLAADPKLETVAGISADWNFYHPGQFAHDYRRVFGELPSATLARIR